MGSKKPTFKDRERGTADHFEHHVRAELLALREQNRATHSMLQRIIQKENKIMTLIDELEAEATSDTDVVTSALKVIDRLAAALEAAGTDQTRIRKVLDTLKTDRERIAAAVVANTPAEPTPEPSPAPPPG